MREQTNQRAHFAKLVIQISRRWRRRVDQALANQGFTQATGLPLLILSREGQIRQGALVEELGLEGPSLVRVIDMLEADGLLRRRKIPRIAGRSCSRSRRRAGTVRGSSSARWTGCGGTSWRASMRRAWRRRFACWSAWITIS